MTRLNQSPNATLQERLSGWGLSSMREMGFALSTKLALLPLVARRLDDDLRLLADQLKDEQRVRECVATGAAYPVAKSKRAFRIVVDIDSFLFEARSVCEIVGRFLREFFRYILEERIDQGDIKARLEKRNLDTRWVDELRENRVLFFHNTAPWIAAQVISENPLRFDLVVMKKDIRSFASADCDDYFHLETLRDIYKGFMGSMTALHQWINEEIERFEKNHQGK